jgi:NarL family two-component system sensor histidine kinase LiaS
MRKAPRPFRRLQWRLTLLYILTTLVAALTLGIGTAIAIGLTPTKTPTATPAEILSNAMLFTEAPQLVSYLKRQPPDRASLSAWAAVWTPGFTYSKMGFIPRATGASAPAVEQIPAGYDEARAVSVDIVGVDGQALAQASARPDQELITNPQAQALLRTALFAPAKSTPYLPAAILPDGRTVVCAPVVAYVSGPTLGALLIAATLVAGPPIITGPDFKYFIATIYSILPTTLSLIALACVAGTLFGVVASRGIIRRLRGITLAAESWSHGDFQASVRDTGGDELGVLAADLNTMAANLQRLMFARQELAAVEERQRLARDLHDSVKQRTFVLSMLVGAARSLVAGNADAERVLGEAEQVTSQTQQELTGIIHALRPLELVGEGAKGLDESLRESCAAWSQRTGIPVQFHAACETALPLDVERELTLVAREALTNVARHSGATAVEISLAAADGCATLTVQDNGHGFDPNHLSGQGIGLSSMRERMEALGGTLEIASGEQGTRVTARAGA